MMRVPRSIIRLLLLVATATLVWCCIYSRLWLPVLWLPFVALVPFALTLRACTTKAGFLWGWCGGALCWAGAAWWIYNGFTTMMGWPAAGALCILLFIFLCMGLPYGLLGLILSRLEQRGAAPGPFVRAGLFTLLLYPFFTLFPGSLASLTHSFPLAMQVADLGGVHLVTFLLLYINWLVAELLIHRNQPRAILKNGIVLALVLAMVLGYGAWRIKHFNTLAQAAPDAEFLTVTTVQPNIKNDSWDNIDTSGPYAGKMGVLVKLTDQAAKLGASDLVAWPEIPDSTAGNCEEFRLRGVQKAAEKSHGQILAPLGEYDYGNNLPERVPSTNQKETRPRATVRKIEKKFNTLWLIDAHSCAPAYRKVKLMPFGERTPLSGVFPWLQTLLGSKLEYTPGPGPTLVSLKNNKRVQALICYESFFPLFTRQGARMGADAFINPSNDAWFVSPQAAKLNLAHALLRAVEQRRPLVRVTNSAFGAHVSATGEIIPGTFTPANTRATRKARLHCPKEITLYARVGDSWLWLLFACVVFRLRATIQASHHA